MRVTLLLAQCTSDLLQRSVQIVTNVLQELEVEIHRVELHRLPYFEGSKTRQMDSIMASVESSDGVIAISAVPLMGMHGAMQSFFDNATQYDMKCFNKPMMAVTYSEWLGEQEAAQMMQKCWGILGGSDGGNIYMNKAIVSPEVLARLEKEVENFYRLMKQERPNIGSSERALYYNIKQGHIGQGFNGTFVTTTEKKPEIKNFADIVREDSFAGRMNYHNQNYNNNNYQEEPLVQVTTPTWQSQNPVQTMQPSQQTNNTQVVRNSENNSHRIDIATKEQTIKEIAQLLEKETSEDTFQSMQSGVYTRPPQVLSTN
ncbi:MAG: NAD(P)H-dependent oxidoreductase, partial [Cellulosilyticum sp.]|nr:NAD(P)H-dependent oxidoreductase [Cellulosilyticum sp.]